MGREIVRVPPDWVHPSDEDDEPIDGAHHELLYEMPASMCTPYQIYQNVSEGSPVSPPALTT